MKRNATLIAVLGLFVVAFAGMAAAQDIPEAPDVEAAGTWNVTIHSTISGPMNEMWMLKQEGNEVTGMVKTDKGEMQIKGMVSKAVIRGLVMEGDVNHQFNVVVTNDASGNPNDFSGTIRMGRNSFLVMGKRTE